MQREGCKVAESCDVDSEEIGESSSRIIRTGRVFGVPYGCDCLDLFGLDLKVLLCFS